MSNTDTAINLQNLRKINESSEEDILKLFHNSEKFRNLVRQHNWLDSAEYYFNEVLSEINKNTCVLQWECDSMGYDPQIRLNLNHRKSDLFVPFIDGLVRVQRNYCFLPDDKLGDLDMLTMIRDKYEEADMEDEEYYARIEGTLKALVENMVKYIDIMIAECLEEAADPATAEKEADYIAENLSDSLYYDIETFTIYNITENIDKEINY